MKIAIHAVRFRNPTDVPGRSSTSSVTAGKHHAIEYDTDLGLIKVTYLTEDKARPTEVAYLREWASFTPLPEQTVDRKPAPAVVGKAREAPKA